MAQRLANVDQLPAGQPTGSVSFNNHPGRLATSRGLAREGRHWMKYKTPLRPRYNVCPTDPLDVVTAEDGKRELVTMRWALCRGGEQAAQRTADGDIQRARRNGRNKARIPRRFQALALSYSDVWLLRMEGYAERQQPWYFTAPDGSPLLTAAGLWDEWKDRSTGERLKSCTMIVTEAKRVGCGNP
jgi:putative SOS response-associated peptidase YedK